MFNEKAKSTDTVTAGLVAVTSLQNSARGGGVFHVQCLDKDGNLKWEEKMPNLVVNEGLQSMNTQYFNYSGSRKAVTFGTATTADPSVISNSASPSSFSISGAGGVVAGAFLCTVSSGTSGVLFSEADFQSPGDRTVVSGDTLNVTYTFSLDAA